MATSHNGWCFLEIGVAVIPHPAKAAKGGEDSCSTHPFSLCVADGVGGWAEVGIDPSGYSRALARGALEYAKECEETGKECIALDAMRAGYDAADGVPGSSTMTCASLVGPVLHTANLGDSGVMLYRKGELLYRSKEQQHSFNFPYQMGVGSRDSPNEATIRAHDVQEGDFVILGTDGLFDNVFEETISDMVRVHRNVDELAGRLANLASLNAHNTSFMSPFAVNAQLYGINGMLGGKVDDITVVVGHVKAPGRLGRVPHSMQSIGTLGVVTTSLFEQTELWAMGSLTLVAFLFCMFNRAWSASRTVEKSRRRR